MDNKELREKIVKCKALQGKSVLDILASDRFGENLATYWLSQQKDRQAAIASFEAMRKSGGFKGYKLPAHPIDKLAHLSAEEMAVEYTKVVAKTSERLAAERKYIQQLGFQAYNLTILQIASEEFPEIKESFLKPKKAN